MPVVPVRLVAPAILAALALAGCSDQTAAPEQAIEAPQSQPEVATIPPAELAEKIAAGEVLLIDVRRPEEFATGHLPGALNAPLDTFDPAAIPNESGRETVLYCRSSHRSGMAAEKLAQYLGGKVRHMEGGLMAWEEAGLEVIPEAGPEGSQGS